MVKTSELERLSKIKEKSQTIGEFLEWLNEQGITLCERYKDTEMFYPIVGSREQLLAEYYGIDLGKVEAEKQAILKDIRGSR